MQNGAQALSYARSRHFEEKIDGRWQVDGTGDVGRGDRQRYFMSVLVKQAVRYLAENPIHIGLTVF
jgi:anionic cell wall polymer biosynthesis LytR-Cps2A-Psr (LCP) family protein